MIFEQSQASNGSLTTLKVLKNIIKIFSYNYLSWVFSPYYFTA